MSIAVRTYVLRRTLTADLQVVGTTSTHSLQAALSQDLPTRRRDPDHLLRLHDELDDLQSLDIGWKSASVLAVVLATFMLGALRLGIGTGLGWEIVVILIAGIGTLATIGIYTAVRAGTLRREIHRFENDASGSDGRSS